MHISSGPRQAASLALLTIAAGCSRPEEPSADQSYCMQSGAEIADTGRVQLYPDAAPELVIDVAQDERALQLLASIREEFSEPGWSAKSLRERVELVNECVVSNFGPYYAEAGESLQAIGAAIMQSEIERANELAIEFNRKLADEREVTAEGSYELSKLQKGRLICTEAAPLCALALHAAGIDSYCVTGFRAQRMQQEGMPEMAAVIPHVFVLTVEEQGGYQVVTGVSETNFSPVPGTTFFPVAQPLLLSDFMDGQSLVIGDLCWATGEGHYHSLENPTFIPAMTGGPDTDSSDSMMSIPTSLQLGPKVLEDMR
ncbi:hypothetical protein MRY87_06870 [bacterium]|nr:hypothetical protein [bacterium]